MMAILAPLQLAVASALLLASCAAQRSGPDVWTLDIVSPSSDGAFLEISMGKHQSLEACQKAGADWLNEHPESSGANLECRLNCYEAKNHWTVCEGAEPIRRQGGTE